MYEQERRDMKIKKISEAVIKGELLLQLFKKEEKRARVMLCLARVSLCQIRRANRILRASKPDKGLVWVATRAIDRYCKHVSSSK